MSQETDRIVAIYLDERSVLTRSPQVAHDRKAAIIDLISENQFRLDGGPSGPYHLHLAVHENRLGFDVRDTSDGPLRGFVLSLSPFRAIVREYRMVCDSYYQAIKNATPSQIEAIDMGRRGLHNDGTEILIERLKGKVDMDFDTARRLFTLIIQLHNRGDVR